MKGEKLKLVRMAMRVSQKKFAEALELPQPHLSEMENCLRPVPEHIRAKVNFYTGFSQKYLDKEFVSNVPSGSILFRKTRDKFRADNSTHAYCQLVFDVFEPMVSALRPMPVKLPAIQNISPEQGATCLRSALGFRASAPVENLTSIAERLGVRIIAIPEPELSSEFAKDETEDCFDAFSFWSNNQVPVVFIKAQLQPDKFNWALGHELIHLVIHSIVKGDLRKLESECQVGTREFFLPKEHFIEGFPVRNVSVSSVSRIARKWNVSNLSVIFRAYELGLISDSQKRYHLKCLGSNGNASGFLVRRQLPRFYRQVCEIIFGNPIDPGVVARATGTSRDFILDVLKSHSGLESNLIDHTNRNPVPCDTGS